MQQIDTPCVGLWIRDIQTMNIKALTLRSLGFHESPHEHCETVQFFINSSPKSGRPRTRSSTTIWNLPDSVIVAILRGLHVKDLLSFRSVHPYFCEILDSYQNSLWKCVSFFNCWPEDVNQHHFVKASACGNVEATIKLAVACLYKEGLTKDGVTKVASEAATYLSLAESLTPDTFPFFWIFIRPPWAPDGSCCKVQAFNHIKGIVDRSEDKDLAFGIALTLKLQRLSVQEMSKSEEQKYFDLAAKQNSTAATFFSLLDINPSEEDTGQGYERIRLLRKLSSSKILEAKINLVRSYIQGHYGGITETMAKEYVRQFFISSKPSGIHSTFLKGPTSDISRYILVDWLVEVVGMKDFSAHTLYLAVGLFDRFLQMRCVQRNKVQLLGVAAIVISSRFLGFDILTIREAAWLTDNSYTYRDVVKMMGELVATLEGNIRMVTIQDFVKILLMMTGENGYMAMLVEYIAMLCLLQSDMGQYSPAEIAASCLLLSRLLLNKGDPWPDHLKDWTGYTQDDLSLCTFHIHKKCVLEGSEVNYRDAKLCAVKLRYADSNRYSVSNIEVIGHKELCRRLGVTRFVNHGRSMKAMRFCNKDQLLMSPRRLKKHPEFLSQSFDEEAVDRTNAATPPIRHAYGFEANISGYDGDYEEDSDECLSEEYEVYDSHQDFSTTFDHFDESHEWDSEVSMMEDEPSDIENNSNICEQSRQVKNNNDFVCLSSMCHSGNNVNCHASTSSPSRYVSNCSCQRTLVDLSLKRRLSQSSNGQLVRPLHCAQDPLSSVSQLSSLPASFTPECIPYVHQSSNSVASSLQNDSLYQVGKRKITTRNSRLPTLSASFSTCDTQPSKICDKNGNHAQFPSSTLNYDEQADIIHLATPKRSVTIVNSEGHSNDPAQGFELTKSFNISNSHGPAKKKYFSHVANMKRRSSKTSSFIEMSCSSNSNELNSSSENTNFCVSGSFKVALSWQRNPSLHFDIGSDKSQLYSHTETPCCSEPERLRGIMSPSNFTLSSSHVQSYCNHSHIIGRYSNFKSQNRSFAAETFSETHSSRFMSDKRIKLGPSSLSSKLSESQKHE